MNNNDQLLNHNENGLMLALDTSTSSMTAAVLSGSHLLGQRSLYAERNHSMYIIPALQELLAELRLKSHDLNIIAVGHGPGSYTGVRIGITVAKTMAWALDCRVLGVSSLEAIALGAAFELDRANGGGLAVHGLLVNRAERGPYWFVPLLDARRTQAYTALYANYERLPAPEQGVPKGWSRLDKDGIRLIDNWVDHLLARIREAEEAPKQVVFTGETAGFEAALARFAEAWSGVTTVLPYELQAYHTGLLGLQRLEAGDTDDVHGLVPNYTQLAEAEVKLLAKQRG